MENKKYVYLAFTFVTCMALGFGITKLCQDDSSEEVAAYGGGTSSPVSEASPSSSSADMSSESQMDTSESNEVVSDNVNQSSTSHPSVQLQASRVRKSGKTYSFSVSCNMSNLVDHYELWSARLVQRSRTGSFSDVPGIASGRYNVCAVGSDGSNLGAITVTGFEQDTDADNEANRMSAREFQNLLLNQHDNTLLGGKNPKVARSVSISVTGINEDERRPDDILAVREKIAFGTWHSAIVVSVGYDSRGRINSVVVRPVY